jgi:hypothetical protein
MYIPYVPIWRNICAYKQIIIGTFDDLSPHIFWWTDANYQLVEVGRAHMYNIAI